MQKNNGREDSRPEERITIDLGVDVSALKRTARIATEIRPDVLRTCQQEVFEQTAAVRRMAAEMATFHGDVTRRVQEFTELMDPLRDLSIRTEEMTRGLKAVGDLTRQWNEIAEKVIRPALRSQQVFAAAMSISAPQVAETLRAAQLDVQSLAADLRAASKVANLGMEAVDVEALRKALDQIEHPPEKPSPDEEAVRWIARIIGEAAERFDWDRAETINLIGLLLTLFAWISSEQGHDALRQGQSRLQEGQRRLAEDQRQVMAGQDSIKETIRRRCGPPNPGSTTRRVVVKTAPLRAEPSADAAVRDTLAPNRAITPLEDRDSWLRVRAVDYADGGAISGWIRIGAVMPADGVEEDG